VQVGDQQLPYQEEANMSGDRTRGLALIGVVILAASAVGCSALPKGTVMFQHSPLLPKGSIPVKAELTTFKDTRPTEEREALRNVSGVADQITAIALKDFKDARVFESIELRGELSEVDVFLRGEVRSFSWDSAYNGLQFIPYVNLLAVFGVPTGKTTWKVALYLEVVNARTQQVIASYTRSSEDERSFTLYNATDHRASGGEEASNAFRVVMDDLQSAILQDRARILDAVHAGSAR
jgi:hypothetical protein